MALGIILFVIAILILAMLLYSVFCYAPSEDSRRENADRCISCGEIIPEGRWVCPSCERKQRRRKMAELKPCPFCGGNGKISFKDKYWGGWNGKGDHRKAYRVQVICKSCYGRGKPILTDWLINPNPYSSIYSGRYTAEELENPVIKKHTEMFRPYVEQAIEAWNRRAK